MRMMGLGAGILLGGGMCVPLGYGLEQLERAVPKEEVLAQAPTGTAKEQRDLTGEVISNIEAGHKVKVQVPSKK